MMMMMKETLLKSQKRHEESTMKGSVNPQQAIKLLKNQQQQQQRPKVKSMSPRSKIRPQISLKQEKKSNGQEWQRWPKSHNLKPRKNHRSRCQQQNQICLMSNNLFQYHKVMKVCYLQGQVLLQEQTFLEISGLHTKVQDLQILILANKLLNFIHQGLYKDQKQSQMNIGELLV